MLWNLSTLSLCPAFLHFKSRLLSSTVMSPSAFLNPTSRYFLSCLEFHFHFKVLWHVLFSHISFFIISTIAFTRCHSHTTSLFTTCLHPTLNCYLYSNIFLIRPSSTTACLSTAVTVQMMPKPTSNHLLITYWLLSGDCKVNLLILLESFDKVHSLTLGFWPWPSLLWWQCRFGGAGSVHPGTWWSAVGMLYYFWSMCPHQWWVWLF